MEYTIISKRPTPFVYTRTEIRSGIVVATGKSVIINGGAGIVGGAERLSGRPLDQRGIVVPEGVATVVNEEILDYLRTIPKFRSDEKRGMIVVMDKAITNQDEIDKIATKELESNENLNARPYTKEDIENAGGIINRDGSVNISDAIEDIDAVRRRNAGQPFYVKKRNLEEGQKKRGRKKGK